MATSLNLPTIVALVQPYMFHQSSPSKTPTKRLGRQKLTRELNFTAGNIDDTIVESVDETPV